MWDRSVPAKLDITVRPLASATPEIDAVWNRAAGQLRTSLVRDRSWVAWRYCDFPGRAYRLTLAERAGTPAGYAVYRVVRHADRIAVHVPEVFAADDRLVYRALVRDVVARAVAEDAETVVTLAAPETSAARELGRAGFAPGKGGWPLEVIRLDPAVPRAPLREANGWWLVGGDFDVI